jgi:two-component system chemotaxis sensor kinase CheA
MADFDIGMYRDMFVEEAEELFESADNLLLKAENNGNLDDDQMGQLFRDVHTLKGSGASVELAFFAEFTHDVENLMDNLRNHKIEFLPEMAGTLIDGLDVMKEILQMECDGVINRENFNEMSTVLLATIRGYINGKSPAKEEPKKSESDNSNQSLDNSEFADKVEKSCGYFDGSEVSTLKNNNQNNTSTSNNPSNLLRAITYGFFGEDELVLEESNENDFGFFDDDFSITPDSVNELSDHRKQSDSEMVNEIVTPNIVEKAKPAAKKVVSNGVVEKPIKKTATTNNIRVNLDKIDNLMNNVGDLVITNAMLGQYASTIHDIKVRSSILERLELLERHIREMQNSIMSIRMVPMDSIYSKFPKVVRDISKKLGKKVDFKHEGDTVEIDKAMIEGLTDPLMHVIRNSLDHGLETPDERKASGKMETGTLTISAEQANGQMIISIIDDGKGIDFERVAQKALENGVIDDSAYKAMSDNDKAMLVFGAGLSTAEEVTEISGRGVGMDVVKTNIHKLGGHIKLDTEKNKGTVITIMLPLTLAILDGLDIAVGEMKYILPLSSIVESLQPTDNMIKKIGDGTQDLLMLREEFIPVVRLYELFNIKPKHTNLRDGMLIVVKAGAQQIALYIDEFLHQHQVVVKPLDKNFRAVEGVGAATVRGDGSIGLIIDVVGLINVQKRLESKTTQIGIDNNKKVS